MMICHGNPPLDPDRKEEERVFAEAEAVGLSRTAKIVSDSKASGKKAVLFEGEEASLEAEYRTAETVTVYYKSPGEEQSLH